MARMKGEGVVFGNPRIKDVQASGAKSMSRKADALVLKIVEILRDLADHDKLTHQEAADLLERERSPDRPW